MRNLADEYLGCKDIARRYELLKKLVFSGFEDMEFFAAAFKKERYLDMKLTAVRGFAKFGDEKAVAKMMKKLLELLINRAKTTPYNYQEYEILRSEFLMKFLLREYDYACFKEFGERLEAQYEAMPEAFKGIFTCDASGQSVALMPPEAANRRINEFFGK